MIQQRSAVSLPFSSVPGLLTKFSDTEHVKLPTNLGDAKLCHAADTLQAGNANGVRRQALQSNWLLLLAIAFDAS